jgi:hypothetical protein
VNRYPPPTTLRSGGGRCYQSSTVCYELSGSSRCYEHPRRLLPEVAAVATRHQRLLRAERWRPLLRAAEAFATGGSARLLLAAAAVAIGGSRVYYRRWRPSLPAAAAIATSSDIVYCYRRWRRLLPKAGGASTRGRQWCYRRPPTMLQTVSAVLPKAAGDAPSGHQWVTNVVDASEVSHRS